MRVHRFDKWSNADAMAAELRRWTAQAAGPLDVAAIESDVITTGDKAVRRLTARLDAINRKPDSLALVVEEEEIAAAAAGLDPALRDSLELAAANIRAVAEAQLDLAPRTVTLSQGQTVTIRAVPVESAAIYAPGGRAPYPSTVLMGAIPARVAGVERIVLTSPPDPDGRLSPLVLAAAELCGIDRVYAMGGSQAVFALAHGTATIPPVDVIVGPGNNWVQEGKRRVFGRVGLDSYAGPSELMVIAGHDANPEWIALDLCAQAEHGKDTPLVAVAVEAAVLDGVQQAVERVVKRMVAADAEVHNAPLALVLVPDLSDAMDLANAFAPEHLELFEEDAALLADRVRTAGCVFVGRYGATAFGDYVAGSNHILPTGGAGRFSGPLGPGAFIRKIASVEVSADAAAKLAPHAETIARAEGFLVHGESAMIRAKDE